MFQKNILIIGDRNESEELYRVLLDFYSTDSYKMSTEKIDSYDFGYVNIVFLCSDMTTNSFIRLKLQEMYSHLSVVTINNKYLLLLIIYHLRTKRDIPLEQQIKIFIPMTKEKYRTILHNILDFEPYKYDIVVESIERTYDSTYADIASTISDYRLAVLQKENDGSLRLASSDNVYRLPKELNHDNKALEFLAPSKVIISAQIRYMPDDIYNMHLTHSLIIKPIGTEQLAKAYMVPDYVIVPTKSQFTFLTNLLSQYKLLATKNTCLIPAGYPKLDKLVSDLNKINVAQDSICYAPTLLVHNQDFIDTLSLQNGKTIIKKLLYSFDCDVIFRPHPISVKYEHCGKAYVEEILEAFGSNPRFVYDDDGYYINTFARSITMISDFSSTMQTFAFATLRPFVALSTREFDAIYGNTFGDDDIRKKSGIVVDSIDGMVEAVKEVIDNLDFYKTKIKEHRDDEVYNLGSSTEYLRENFEYIIENKPNKDWFYVKSGE